MNNGKVYSALEDIRKGIPIIVVDDYDRENEGDVVIAAEKANARNLAFCMRYARGLMCLPCSGKILDRLKVSMMVENPTDKLNTPFTVSVDAITTTTGMSVHDRLKTIAVFLDEKSKPEHLQKPGHLFPLRARVNLLKDRRGHTESSVELMKLAGLKEIGVIAELINDDGTMTKGDEIEAFARNHNLKIISVAEIYNAVYKEAVKISPIPIKN